jgi:hypothetical protein
MKRRISCVVDQPEFPLSIDSKLPHNLRRQVFEQIKQKIGGSSSKALEIEREIYSSTAPSVAAYKTKFLTWKNKTQEEKAEIIKEHVYALLERLLLTEDQLIANNYLIEEKFKLELSENSEVAQEDKEFIHFKQAKLIAFKEMKQVPRELALSHEPWHNSKEAESHDANEIEPGEIIEEQTTFCAHL